MVRAKKPEKIIPGKPVLEILLLFLGDLLGLGLSILLASAIRSLIPLSGGNVFFDPQIGRTYAFVILFCLITLALRGLYPGWGRASVIELKQVIESITLAYVLTSGLIFIQGNLAQYSRSAFLLSWFFAILILPVSRFLIRKMIALFAWYGEPVVILGSVKSIQVVKERLVTFKRIGMRPVLGISLDSPKPRSDNESFITPWSENLLRSILKSNIRTIVLATPSSILRKDFPHIFKEISLKFQKTVFILENDLYSTMMAEPIEIKGSPALVSKQALLNPTIRFIQRLVDYFLSIIVLIPVLLLGILLAIWIRIDSPGSIFYKQIRVGKDGKRFELIKFRTMVANSHEILEKVLKDPKVKKDWIRYHKIENDPRITRAGKWIRRFSLDELPQIINILRGDMSLIGPRPLVPVEYKELGDAAPLIFCVRPGMTGWWQVNGRNNLSFEERTQLDFYYVFNWSLWLDLFIFIKTFWVMIVPENEKK
jgi:Undecaprenyl-phosphate galactose phosphotransferase WbaP